MTTQITSSDLIPAKDDGLDYKMLYQELQAQYQFTLSQISHEIRNPVTLINSFLQIVENRHPNLTQDDCWIKVLKNMDFLKSLLEEFSSFNNSGKLHIQNLNLYHLLSDIVDSVTPACQTLEISVVLQKETAIPLILADETKIKQLILNLIRNAKEAIGTQGTITCSLKSDGESVTLSIQDTGAGIPEDYQKNLFEPFITHKQEGTGLGLAICKRIAEAHGGNISFRSVPQKGSAFTIVLPVC